MRPTREYDRRDRLCNIATTSLFNIINRESKELLPRSIFIIIRRYKRVEIPRCKEESSPNKKHWVPIQRAPISSQTLGEKFLSVRSNWSRSLQDLAGVSALVWLAQEFTAAPFAKIYLTSPKCRQLYIVIVANAYGCAQGPFWLSGRTVLKINGYNSSLSYSQAWAFATIAMYSWWQLGEVK